MDHVENMMDKLLEAARQTGGAAWPMYVERIYYGAITLVAAMLILSLASLCLALYTRGKPMTDDGDETGWFFLRLIGIAVFIITLSIAVGGLPAVLSPAGEAVMRIIGK